LMHVAAAVNARVVAIIGPTEPRVTGPFGDNHVIVRKNIPCAPCRYRDCPTDHTCMDSITPEDVLEPVAEFISEERPGS